MSSPTTPKKPNTGKFVVKESHGDGSITWVNSETMEEIRLHENTAPTESNLKNLAFNGIIPKRPTIDDPEFAYDDPLPDDADPDDDSPEAALGRLLTKIKTVEGARTEVRVHKVTDGGKGGKEAYCATYTVEDYEKYGDELIRSQFGDGTYRVRVYGPSLSGSKHGAFCMLANNLVEIVPSLVPVKSPLQGAGGDTGIPGGIALMIQNLNNEIARLKNGPQIDTMAQFMQFAGLMKQLGMVGSGGKEKSIIEQLKELEALKDFKDKHLGEGGDDKPAGLMDMAGKALEIISNAQRNPQIPMQNPGELPALNIPGALSGAENMESEMNPSMQFMLNVGVAGLLDNAKQGTDFNKVAEELADTLPDEAINILEKDMLWFPSLKAACPNHAADLDLYREWVTKVRNRTLELLYEDEAPVEAPNAPTPPPTQPPVAKRKRGG